MQKKNEVDIKIYNSTLAVSLTSPTISCPGVKGVLAIVCAAGNTSDIYNLRLRHLITMLYFTLARGQVCTIGKINEIFARHIHFEDCHVYVTMRSPSIRGKTLLEFSS